MQPSSNPYAAKALARKLPFGGHNHDSAANVDMSAKEQERLDSNKNNAFSRFNSCQNQKDSKLFGKYVDGTDKQDRLTQLIEKVEDYTRFVLTQNIKHHRAQERKKNNSKLDIANQNGGKASVSKRR